MSTGTFFQSPIMKPAIRSSMSQKSYRPGGGLNKDADILRGSGSILPWSYINWCLSKAKEIGVLTFIILFELQEYLTTEHS